MTDSVQDEWNKLVQQSRKDAAIPPPPPPLSPEERRKPRWILPIVFVLSLVALALYFQGALDPWPAKPTQEEIEAGRKASMMMAARAIHDYAAFHGSYPEHIEQVMPLAVQISYKKTADGFELRMPGPDGDQVLIQGK